MSEENNNEQQVELPPVKVAFILDNVVVDVLHTDERLASIFLGNPVIENVTGEDGIQTAWIGDDYDAESHTFSREGVAPETEVDQSMNPIKVAFIIDNKVVDVVHTDERLAAIFLSGPVVVNVTREDGSQGAEYGDIYDAQSGEFTAPEGEQGERPPVQVDFEGWVYDEELGHNVPPVPYPSDGKLYIWDNETLNWVEETN